MTLDFNRTLAGLLLHPRATARAVAAPERLVEGALLYAASLLAAALFYSSLPADLPAAFLEYFPYLTGPRLPLLFWLKMGAWGTLLFLIEVSAVAFSMNRLGGRTRFLEVLSFFCWLHLFYLGMFLLMQAGVSARSAEFTYLSEVAGTLWSLYVAVVGLKEISRSSIPRAFLSIALASLAVFAALFAAHRGGLVGPEELKALILF